MASHRSDNPHQRDALQHLTIGGASYETTLTKKFLRRKPWMPANPREIRCVIPGVILKIHVRAGQKVHKGDALAVLEAMKMQNDLLSDVDGTVRKLHVKVGQQVSKGELLIEME
jgi:biotin carboxyl carrier protein